MGAIQQGDVRIIEVQEIPAKAKKVTRQERGYVLAEGEHTGHMHVITDDVDLYEHNGKLYLKTTVDVPLKHEEHRQVIVPQGIWEVKRVREYDHFAEESRQVAD